jgi:peptide/nickel transport system ATP-binding protein
VTTVVEVSGLNVVARGDDAGETRIVRDVAFSIDAGEVLALIGESGSGKTTTALALMGYARRGCRISGGRIRTGGTDVLALRERELAGLRGRAVAYIAQSAAAAFNPSKTIIDQVVEPALIHRLTGRREAEAKAVELFRALALPDPETIGARYPHQVSGGQLQRLMAAMALITDPALVILDEPTSSLDVTTQIEVLRAFRKVVRERRTTALYVTHDLSVVAQMADRVVVLRNGEMREIGSTDQILSAPRDDYTRALLAAARPVVRTDVAARPTAQTAAPPLLEVRNLSAGYGRVDRSGLPATLVLHDFDLTIARGSTVGVIGESGSGKTTLARVIAGLVAPARGQVRLDGAPLPPTLAGRTREQFRRIQIVFQMADTALNPSHTIERILARPLALYRGLTGADSRRRIAHLLDLVQLPASVSQRLPGELSGGQKQRVNLARALAAEPDLILCDEVISALDTVVGAAILELLAELRRELGVSYLFISHDLATVRAVCDEIVVMYAGRKVESAPREAMARPPRHPYSDLLIASMPELRRGWLDELGERRWSAPGPAVSSRASGRGCSFVDRCAVKVPGVCDAVPPPRRQLVSGAEILCHRTEAELIELQQQPAKTA